MLTNDIPLPLQALRDPLFEALAAYTLLTEETLSAVEKQFYQAQFKRSISSMASILMGVQTDNGNRKPTLMSRCWG